MQSWGIFGIILVISVVIFAVTRNFSDFQTGIVAGGGIVAGAVILAAVVL